LTLIFE